MQVSIKLENSLLTFSRGLSLRQLATSAQPGQKQKKSQESSSPSAGRDDLRVKIGLEIHARIQSRTKIFSDSDTANPFARGPNMNAAHFDCALPGTMPTLNRRCVEASLLTALALNCNINGISNFERKHYFYADLPAGFQITQQRRPVAINGLFKYPIFSPKTNRLTYKQCRIKRIQLEHDSAKSFHTEKLDLKVNDVKLAENSVLVDLNRAGMGLMEIVTEPDLEEALESYSFARELALALRSIGTCEANMGDGGFRVDVNVSVHELDRSVSPPKVLPGVRVELKNLNSFSAILKATEYEISRQKKLVKSGKPVVNETRSYDGETNRTISLRSKEDQYDYRFMPEPNLLPLFVYPSETFSPNETASKCFNNPELRISQSYLDELTIGNIHKRPDFYVDLDKVRSEFRTKTLPQSRREILTSKLKISDETAFVFIANDLDRIFFRILESKQAQNADFEMSEEDVRFYVRILTFDYIHEANQNPNLETFDFELKCKKISSYIDVMQKKLVSSRIAAKLLSSLFEHENLSKTASDLVEEKRWFIVDDAIKINESIRKLFEANPKAVQEYQTKEKKRSKIFDFFVGRVHKEFNDLADVKLVDKLVQEALDQLLK